MEGGGWHTGSCGRVPQHVPKQSHCQCDGRKPCPGMWGRKGTMQ